MPRSAWKFWAAAGLSAGLLELPFPLAGPLPPARSIVAWFALAPLLWAVLRVAAIANRPLRTAFLLSYVCGVLWYAGNCYWIYNTMLNYGEMPRAIAALLLAGFSMVLGAYFGLFGFGLALLRRRFGLAMALRAAPFLWVALDLAAARITSVPWDQLGYSQIDNALLTRLAPWTGVYGITFVLICGNALFAAGFLLPSRTRRVSAAITGFAIAAVASMGLWMHTPTEPTSATAVLVQPNLDVSADNIWNAPKDWNQHIVQFTQLAEEQCKSYIAGIPQTGATTGEIVCPPYPTHPDLVAWPEAPAPFFQMEPRFQQAMAGIAKAVDAPLVVGGIGMEYSSEESRWREYNSAMVFDAQGQPEGRYDKIHLVPFGEYVPFEKLLFFAKKLTGRVSKFDRGTARKAFHMAGQHGQMHRYGILICYEAVFADEVRHFAANGAEVLVNISDDGWYGDTSAPWQHLNMARMRAVENRRWLLRDTNNGVTAAIDPYGRVRQSIPRHKVDALPAEFSFRDDITFYTRYGDVFAWCCAVLAAGVVVIAVNKRVSEPASQQAGGTLR